MVVPLVTLLIFVRNIVKIIVYKNTVIGGDICSSDIEGFIHGFANPNTIQSSQ